MPELLEIDSLTAMVIVDNEVDPISAPAPGTVQVSGQLPHIAMRSKIDVPERGGATKELTMEECLLWTPRPLNSACQLAHYPKISSTENPDRYEGRCSTHLAL